MHSELFTQLSILIVIAAILSLIMRLLRQPLMIGYIITGILAGPSFLNIIKDTEGFSVLSTIGIALLLFVIGLELRLDVIKRLRKVVAITTTIQIVGITLICMAIGSFFNFTRAESAIVGLCMSLSSTIIIITLLQEKKQASRLFAQIAIGVLILQDLFATMGKIVLASGSNGNSVSTIMMLLVKGILLTIAVLIVSRFLGRLNKLVESHKELMMVFAIGWAFGVATLYAKVGFSVEIGALLAGIGLAGLPFSHEASSRLKPIRDLFIIIFLITLGSTLLPESISSIIVPSLVFATIVMVVKPLFILLTLGVMGYTKQASFKAAISMSQVSEFSLIFIVAALDQNYVSKSAQSIVGMTALLTFVGSTYLIKYDEKLFSITEKYLRFFERRVAKVEQINAASHHPIVLFGYRKGGAEFIRTFQSMNKHFVVVDYDPEAIELIEKNHVNFVYGDATDPELIDELGLAKSKLVVSNITDPVANEFLAHWLSTNNPSAVFVASAESAYQAAHLYNEGASYVMMPHFIGSEKISTFIKRSGFKKSEFNKFREKHMQYLQAHYSEEPA
jgi:Kef-type K+ transport system membrane component KefB